jgi:hypothetical protein
MADPAQLVGAIHDRGDIGHIALFLWAVSASALLVWTLKELARANRRFESFVAELARLNRLFGKDIKP